MNVSEIPDRTQRILACIESLGYDPRRVQRIKHSEELTEFYVLPEPVALVASFEVTVTR
jgi:hypothetical protein